jgi:hypothetical protein
MATINITYRPNFVCFFNSDGELVLGDANGNYNQSIPTGWGGLNPAKNTITTLEIFLTNRTRRETYYTNVSFGLLDILSAPYEFPLVNKQIVIPATEFTKSQNTANLSFSDFLETKFPYGFYTVTIKIIGTYTFGLDTVNWKGSLLNDLSSLYNIQNVVNTSCFNQRSIQFLLSKNCKQSKEHKKLSRYYNSLVDYYENPFNLNTLDVQTQGETAQQLFDTMQNICTGKEGGCKC